MCKALVLALCLLRDPTLYIPAGAYYIGTQKDWQSSQVWFDQGYLEANSRFTQSGRPNDTPVSYGVGMRTIRWDTAQVLGVTAAHHTGSRILFNKHKRWGMAERIAFSTGLGYYLSIKHFRQASRNMR